MRVGYGGFNDWFKSKAKQNKKAWVVWEGVKQIGALCIYDRQDNEVITEDGQQLKGAALKLSTFKVGSAVRGQKIGELFLKAAFRYASANRLENIFIHGDIEQQHFLFEMLEDFGFSCVGSHPKSNGRDRVYLKLHPILPPEDLDDPFVYFRSYFPHFRRDTSISKYIVPIRPEYHRILFPDYFSPFESQMELFGSSNSAGNAIKLAYLCHAQTKKMDPGDVVLFYRSHDEKSVTSLGLVEDYKTLDEAEAIAGMVKRRTVYSMEDIQEMAKKKTRVMLFRLVKHFSNPLSHDWLKKNCVLKGGPQSIIKITDDYFEKILNHGK